MSQEQEQGPKPIRRLEESLINRIAAGEVSLYYRIYADIV